MQAYSLGALDPMTAAPPESSVSSRVTGDHGALAWGPVSDP